MPHSLESDRPILAMNRDSTISAAPSTSSINSADERTFTEIESGLRRLEDDRMNKQRFIPSDQKVDTISMLALTAKLDRALKRRLSGQDAVLRRRPGATRPLKAQ